MLRDRTFEEVDLSTLIENVERYHGSRVRVKGICRIEFEGNALYLNQPAFEERRSQQALWLQLGWPPRLGGKELDARRIVVDAVVDARAKGHEGAFAGSLVQIDRLDPAP